MLSTEWALLVLEKVSLLREPLQITPARSFTALGLVGGPFTITNETFSLTNIGTAPLNWSLANTSTWLNASPTGGTLTPGGPAATVTVSLNSNAYSLTSGIYTATVWFTNLNDSVVQSRQFSVTYAQLLAGTSGSGEGKVYAYQGGTNWTAISPSLGYAVLDIIQFNGTLYAATMAAASWRGVAIRWRHFMDDCWDNMDEEVCALEIYNGQLYAGTAYNGGNLYRYNGTNFVYVDTVANFTGIRAMHSSSYGYLQLGEIWSDMFGRYDGTNLYFDTDFYNSGVVDFAEYNNKLYAGAEECAYLFGSTDGINWSVVLDCNGAYALWGLEPFQGQLYLGYDNGQLACMDSSENWHSVLTVSDSIISMVANGNTMLYFGTGQEAVGEATGSGPGYVYAYTGNGATNATLISGPMGDWRSVPVLPTRPFAHHTGNRLYCVGMCWRAVQHNERDFLFKQHRDSTTKLVARYHFLPPCTSSCWLDASPNNGTLAAGGTTNVIVSLNSNAYSLTSGIYTATVWFTNLNDSVVQSRQFTLANPPPPPTITTQPVPVTVPNGASCAFFVTAIGHNMTYQWYRNGTNLVDGGNISGSTKNMLIISPAGPADVFSGTNGYYVTVSGAGGCSSTNSVTNSLTLVAATNLIYNGDGGPTWDLNTTASWQTAGNPNDLVFQFR